MEAEALGPLFVHPESPGRLWILIVGFSVATMVLAMIALIRGRMPAALSSSGLLLLPLFTYVLGDLLVLEESKKVAFCGSCHETMQPIVNAMRSDGDTLAASHYQRGAVPHDTACYSCHSGYGIWGDVSAKLAGVSHMVKTVTRNYTFPLEPAQAFDISSCLDCHAAAVPFRAVEVHGDPDIQQSLLSGEMGCSGVCHAAAHPPEALNGAVSP